MGRDEFENPGVLLANLPPTSRQRRLALGVVVALLVVFAVSAWFGSTPLPHFEAFIPTTEGMILVSDLITSGLLFSQYSIIRSPAILALASGYLFTALIVVPLDLTSPGVFAPSSPLWLEFSWHIAFPTAVMLYAWLKDAEPKNKVTLGSTAYPIGWSVAIVICLVCALSWGATVGGRLLPPFITQDRNVVLLADFTFALNLFISAASLAILWFRRRSSLDLWLTIVVCAWMTEQVLLFHSVRFGLDWYAGRIYSLLTSTILLLVLLSETTSLYGRLAGANMGLQRERDNKLMNMEAMLASISHEVRQPLAAIAMQGGAGLRWLGQAPPNLEEARIAFEEIVGSSHRANEVFESIRALFRITDQGREHIDMNEIALGVIHILRAESEEHGITVRADLRPELPLVTGYKGQLQQVLLNLVSNAIEAMDAIKDGTRVLRVSTQHRDRDAITVAIEDTGPGIDPKKLDDLFDAFVTTKPEGTGLGLAICRMIIEHHGGQLTGWSDGKRGALFQFILPIKSAAGSTAAAD